VSVIDTATNTVIATAPADPGPFGVVVANEKVYVANWTSPFTVTVVTWWPIRWLRRSPSLPVRTLRSWRRNRSNVSVIDTGTDTVIATIPVPISISTTVSSDGTRVYVSAANHLHGFDVVTNQFVVGSDYIGGPGGVSVTQHNSRVYAVNVGWNAVMVVDPVMARWPRRFRSVAAPWRTAILFSQGRRWPALPARQTVMTRASALAKQYGGLNNAAAALGYPSAKALQNTIEAYCEGWPLPGRTERGSAL